MKLYTICITIFILLASYGGYAQKQCNGIVRDYDTQEPISFASVWVKGTTIGTLTQLNGSFSITLPKSSDTLMISTVGYKDYIIPYAAISNNSMEIYAIPTAIILEKTVIRPGKNMAIPIVRNAIKNRRENRPGTVDSINFMEYNKLNISLSGLDSSIFKANFIRKNPEILIKANEYDSTWSVPLYFSERLTLEKRRANKYPEITEIAKNQHGSTFINSDITTKYVTSLNQDMTFYGNLRFLSRDFISPISIQALIYYDYFLRDSLTFEGNTYYQIKFRPKNKQDLAFHGYMIIEKETGALTEIQASLQATANLNYVKSMQIHEQLQKIDGNNWFYKQQKIEIEFTPQLSSDTTNNAFNTPLKAIKTTHFIVDTATIATYQHTQALPKKLQRHVPAIQTDTLTLALYRPDTLSTLDIITREAIEISNNIPAIKATNTLLDMFLYGYLPFGKIEFGPYLYFVQHNEIEGYRYNLAMRTSPKLHDKMMIGGYIGYGSRDKKFKYGSTFALRMPTTLLGILHIKYDQNIYRIGDYKQNLDFVRENVLVQSDDNMLSALTSKMPNKAVYFVKKGSLAYEQQIHPNIIIKPKIEISEHYNAPFYNFDTISNTISSFSVQEVSCNVRISFKEEISNNHFRRMYIDSRYPIFQFNTAVGTYSYDLHTQNKYAQIRFVVRHDILFGVGRLKYVVESGLTSTSVPFPLLEIHRGNETGSSGEYYYNLMEYMEFASDRYINVFAEYGLNGFIFNKIPLIKKLNLRELLTFKTCWGDRKHEQIFSLPTTTKSPTIPYIEAGVGITNVLKIIRIEYIWRLNHLKETQENSGLFFRFQFEF